jgi:hypothetical protein
MENWKMVLEGFKRVAGTINNDGPYPGRTFSFKDSSKAGAKAQAVQERKPVKAGVLVGP